MLTYKDIEYHAADLTAYYRENGLNATAEPVSCPPECYISVEINWGDWKHDHLRCKYLTERFFDEIGKDVVIETEITEEDGSDCYSAIHRIYVDC